MVAGNGNNLQSLDRFRGLEQKVVEQAFGRYGGVGRIENVAGHDESVGLLCPQGVQQPVKKMQVFQIALVAVKVVAEMPVCCMQNLHKSVFFCLQKY